MKTKHSIRQSLLCIFSLCIAMFSLSSCGDELNNNRLPAMPVDINLANAGLWATYGVGGMGQYRRFIKDEKEPSGFAYLATTYTGYGGVLLVGVDAASQFQDEAWGYYPVAYDLACPVEVEADVRVYVDDSSMEAICPKCKSHYAIMSGGGAISGPALTSKYGLEVYRCVGSPTDGFRIVRK